MIITNYNVNILYVFNSTYICIIQCTRFTILFFWSTNFGQPKVTIVFHKNKQLVNKACEHVIKHKKTLLIIYITTKLMDF